MNTYDFVIDNASFLITCDSTNSVFKNYSIGINGKTIAAIAPSGEINGTRRYDAQGKIVAPGLINTHTHLAMTLLRGWAEGVNLQGFLERVWAAEGAIMDGATAKLGTTLGALEALLGGTTTALDMYLFPESTHRGAVEVGLRHIGGPIFFDFPGLDGMQWNERIDFAKKWPAILTEIGGPAVPSFLMPHATYTCSPEHLAEIAEIARETASSIHIHASENENENKEVQEKYGKTPTQILDISGVLGRHTVYGHGVHLTEGDISTLVSRSGAVAHCPGSNLKLASGVADITTYRDRGVKVGLGTDGCSSSNDLDMWSVMRLAAHLISHTEGPERVSASEIFRMATIEGARALGIDQSTGSLEVGKSADIIAIDTNAPHLIPIHNLFAQLIFAAGRDDVCDVWVDGEQVIENRRSTRIDFSVLRRDVEERMNALASLKK
jgi:5-methylthioadenosine/S-adenosylhomocysteine deaminase